MKSLKTFMAGVVLTLLAVSIAINVTMVKLPDPSAQGYVTAKDVKYLDTQRAQMDKLAQEVMKDVH